ncbi:MAG: hypothetical protein FWG89_05070 [Treponema sp.]|nr:hypothetical protein [Treponema sp.]
MFNQKKRPFFHLISAVLTGITIILLLHYALAGPVLGKRYDILMNYRREIPASWEFLLIETGENAEPDDIFSVLMTLNEMGASDFLIEVPVLGTGMSSEGRETGLIHHINDEFVLLNSNIRNLFDAIRLGLVPPAETDNYVDSLIELAEHGRYRINTAIIQQNETGFRRMAQAAAVWGKPLSAVDIQAQFAPDHDGILRRANTEHLMYHVLKPRWTESFIEQTGAGQALVNRFESQGESIEYRFPLDRDGNLLFEKTHDFRRLSLELFLEYDRADRALAALLKDAGDLGVYAGTAPERIPFILFDYSDVLREELLQAPGEENRAKWVNARLAYLASLNEFFSSSSELIPAGLREKHHEFNDIHSILTREVNGSFCVMAPAARPSSSALLANTLLYGRCITPAQTIFSIVLSITASLFVLVCIHALAPWALFFIGFAASLLCGAAFGTSFIIAGYWIDPLIPAAACLGGTIILSGFGFHAAYGRNLLFKFAFAASVQKKMLKKIQKKSSDLLSETMCAEAVFIVVKNYRMAFVEDREKPQKAAQETADFRKTISRYFMQTGAQMLSFEGDTALACFGSPLERLMQAKNQDIPVQQSIERAVQCVTNLLESPLGFSHNSPLLGCRIGIAAGECAFFWSEETGYTANGRAIVRARIFASLANRFRVKAIIGESAAYTTQLMAHKLSALSGESFFELRYTGPLSLPGSSML